MSRLLASRSLVLRAALLSVAYLVSRLAGLPEHTSVLSGTLPDGAASFASSALLGGLHVLLHLGFVVVAPILVLAAIVQWGIGAVSAVAASRRDRRPSRE